MEELFDMIKKVKDNTDIFINLKCRKILYVMGSFLYLYPDKLDILYNLLYERYGNTIMFSKRSLYYCSLFYKKYYAIYDDIPPNMSWNNIVVLIRKNYSIIEDISVFNTIKLFNLNNKEISFFINNGLLVEIIDESVNNINIEFLKLK